MFAKLVSNCSHAFSDLHQGNVLGLAVAVFFVVTGFGPVNAEETAPPETLEALSAEIEKIVDESSTPGLAVTVVEDGKIVLARGYGFADVAAQEPLTADTILSAGSLSKNLTSLGFLRLVETGKLSLKDRLGDVAPEVEIDNPWREEHPILMENLLEHTAGIEGSTYFEYGYNKTGVTPHEYAEMMAGKIEVRWPPGYFFSYANPGHTIAAVAMENACDCDFDSFMEQQIFAPIGMDTASFVLKEDMKDRMAKSYHEDGKTPSGYWEMAIRPSGSLLVTIKDLGALIEFYSTRGGDLGLVSPALLTRMEDNETPATARAGIIEGGYGLGNFGFFGGKGAIFHGHTGSTDGFRTWLGYDPDTGAGFAVISNGGEGRMRHKIRDLITAYLTRDYTEATPAPAVGGVENYVRDGWYAPFTHEMPFRAWLFNTLTAVKLQADGDRLHLDPISPTNPRSTLVHVGGGLFRNEDLPIPTAAMVDGPEGERILSYSVGSAYAPASIFGVYARFYVFIGGLLFGAIAMLHTLFWGPMRALGKLEPGPGFDLRLSLAIAGGAIVAIMGTFVASGLLGGLDVSARLGRVSVVSLVLMALSVIGPIGAIAAAFNYARLPSGSMPLKVYGALAVLLIGGAWIYVALVGWVPFQSWKV